MEQLCAKYSLVFFPLDEQSYDIKEMKQKLGQHFDFRSRNSEAHVTITEIWDDPQLKLYLPRIKSFCQIAIPFAVAFNKLIFGTQTFLIEPDKLSKIYINNFIKNLHIHIGKDRQGNSAHMSIARKLNANQMELIKKSFEHSSVDFKFHCGSLCLRKFNNQTHQYSNIIERIELTGRPQPDLFSS